MFRGMRSRNNNGDRKFRPPTCPGSKVDSMASSVFSIDGSAVISREIGALPATAAGRGMRDYYEIDRCLQFIGSRENFRKVSHF